MQYFEYNYLSSNHGSVIGRHFYGPVQARGMYAFNHLN